MPDPPDPEVAVNPNQSGTLYWLSTDGTTVALNPATIEVPVNATDADALELAFSNLMGGPDSEGVATGIPEQTELLALSVESDGVYVNLSEDFTDGRDTFTPAKSAPWNSWTLSTSRMAARWSLSTTPADPVYDAPNDFRWVDVAEKTTYIHLGSRRNHTAMVADCSAATGLAPPIGVCAE